MNLYLKTFLTCSSIYGLCMVLLSISVGDGSRSISTGIIAGTLFGAVMALVLPTVHMLQVQRKACSAPEQRYKVHQKRAGIIAATYEETRVACLAFLDHHGWVVRAQEPYRLQVQTHITFRSWGENVDILFTSIAPMHTRVEITSRPKTPTTLIDYGKNLDNVEQFMHFIQAARAN